MPKRARWTGSQFRVGPVSLNSKKGKKARRTGLRGIAEETGQAWRGPAQKCWSARRPSRGACTSTQGVRAQEQEGVAGVVIVIVRRSITTASPHGGANASLKQNFTPHGPIRLLACAPPSTVATAPPGLGSTGRAGRQALEGQQTRREAWEGRRRRLIQ